MGPTVWVWEPFFEIFDQNARPKTGDFFIFGVQMKNGEKFLD